MMNVNNEDWRTYITGQYKTQKTEFKFDGTHIDTLGRISKKDASGNPVDLTDGLAALVDDTYKNVGGQVGINLPDGAGNDKLINGSSTYLYTELWDNNETNAQVASYQGVRSSGAKQPMIVAAYANDYDPTTRYWDAAANEYKHPEIAVDNGVRIETEADQSSVSGDVTIVSGDTSASGGSYASGIAKDGDAVTFTVDAGQGGTFTFSPRYSSPQADGASHQVMIDMGKTGQQKLLKYVTFNKMQSDSDWREDISINVELTPGTHTISFPIDKYEKFAPVNIDCITFREFNADSIKLADAAFAANGAHHLELGDYGRMLDNQFFPESGRRLSGDTQT